MDADDVRRKGLDKMNEVYGWQMADQPGEYFALTVDHLFADIWSRPGLSMRDKRLITLSVVTAFGLPGLAEIQVNAALQNQEMTADELRKMAVFITHYVGFPLGSTFNNVVEKVIAQRAKCSTADG
ncbi:carboxymuconolactone decarboxylase family protein [Mycolicibacterium sp.]|uniref:carboxymuconolactone decarboxylase family protein n=1 Tax=Mycolicibacterium sp. TaxID=2320850 RepID=UPI001DF4C128|nr:carboxymuconolactone decarboxylase family protein [Mycolicibacterium sp.]MCB1290155.1 carboxymuconolactone decarboxylase family protein [Mycobacterium sp.]MCB9408705.1 carboxymuconolactone decarboxylase family protein [Mycolicibacterium sp.]